MDAMKEIFEEKKVVEWKKIFVVIAALAGIGLAAWYGNEYFSHFITDKDYRDKSAVEFENRAKLYNVAECIGEAVGKNNLTNKELEALKWLYSSMSLADAADYPPQYYIDNVKMAFRAQEETSWGKSVPEREFRHFVLPVRANNEQLDDFRKTYYEELKGRIDGMSMYEAALEVNHWCHEKATYLPSDSRTSSPMATILTATGRCGEESVLLVAALRCVGIPARQVYTPRWAHTDDNHAWVEVWADGKWYFLGACEPEAVLNKAWFNSSASRALLMHAKVFGNYITDEDIISRTNCYTEINMIGNYVDTRRAVVKVVDTAGVAVENADVEFKIYNYAEFYSVTRQKSDKRGEVALTTGLGDMLAWASYGNRFGISKIDSDTTVVVLEHKIGENFSVRIDVEPPVEGNIPVEVTEEQIEANNRRLACEDSLRNAYVATFYKKGKCGNLKDIVPSGRVDEVEELLISAKGNWREILNFVQNVGPDRISDAIDMLHTVSGKDLRDTPSEILLSHVKNTPPYQQLLAHLKDNGYVACDKVDRDIYVNYILSPRVANEVLSSYRKELLDYGFAVKDIIGAPSNIGMHYRNVCKGELMDDYNPRRIAMTPAGVLRVKASDRHSRNIFTVALLRSCGVPARVDQVTGKPQYYAGEWMDIIFPDSGQNEMGLEEQTPSGYLKAGYKPTKYLPDPQYYRHFTIAKIEDGSAGLLNFEEGDATELGAQASWSTILRDGFKVDVGYYLVTSGTRTASGGVMSNLVFTNVNESEISRFDMLMPKNDNIVSVVGYVDAEQKFLPENGDGETSLLSVTGRGYFTVAILGDKDEPSNHAIRELAATSDVLGDWGRPVVVLTPDAMVSDVNECIGKNRKTLGKLDGIASYGADVGGKIAGMLNDACNGGEGALPIVAIADSFGRVVYYSQGYNTSINSQITDVIEKIR